MMLCKGAVLGRLSARDQAVVENLAAEVRTVRLRAEATHRVGDQVAEALQRVLGRDLHAARRERAIRRRLEPALAERAAFDRLLDEAPLTKAALETCLQLIPRPALVLDSHGQVLFANPLARALVASSGGHLAATLRDCIEKRSSAFTMTRLTVRGAEPHWFAVETARPRDPGPLLVSARARWSLTAREGETLALLAEGLSNRAIAANLECAERTVEVHVARLLSKSKSGNRSELIARFWSEDQLDGG
jgi:DNA-binding CsgD family transcriptional regulator